MDVYWLEQSEADVPLEDDWLSTAEEACLDALRIPKRRADWRLGRWTAKLALSAYLNTPAEVLVLARIEIRPAASGAPEVFVANRPAPVGISLSHCNSNALCVIAAFDTELGCDLEFVEPRSEAFVADYFTAEEQSLVAQVPAAHRPDLVTLLWSAKESALKAIHEGLRLDTRSVVVNLLEGIEPPKPGEEPLTTSPDSAPAQRHSSWRPLEVHCAGGRVFHGWWRQAGNLIRTLVAAPAPNQPIALRITKKTQSHSQRRVF